MHMIFFQDLPIKGSEAHLKEIFPTFEYEIPENNTLSESEKRMLKSCFIKDPSVRPTVDQLLEEECFRKVKI